MFTQAQLEYIEKQFGRKVSREDIIKKLAAAGWENGDIEDGLREVEKKLSKPKEGEVPPPASHTFRTVLLIIGGAVLIAAIGGLAYWKYVWLPKQTPKAETQIAVPVTEEKAEVNIFDATTTASTTSAIDPENTDTALSEEQRLAIEEGLMKDTIIKAQLPSKEIAYKKGEPVTLSVVLGEGVNESSLQFQWKKSPLTPLGPCGLSCDVPSLDLGQVGEYELGIALRGSNEIRKELEWNIFVPYSKASSLEDAKAQFVKALQMKDLEKIISFYEKRDQEEMISRLTSVPESMVEFGKTTSAQKFVDSTTFSPEKKLEYAFSGKSFLMNKIGDFWLVDK